MALLPRAFIFLAACMLFLASSAWSVRAAPILPTSWLQQGGTAQNAGVAWNATFAGNATLTPHYQTLFASADCQNSFVYLAPANSFFFTCWNADAYSNINLTLWQVDAATGAVQFGQSLTAFPQSLSGPQQATPAIYTPKPDTAEGSVVFVQTNIDLFAFRVGSSGIIDQSKSVPIADTVQCGSSVSVSQSTGQVFIISNAKVTAYDATSFFPASGAAAVGRVLWSYSYPDPQVDYLLSAPAEDEASDSLVFTFARSSYGASVVSLSRKDGTQRWLSFFPFPNDNAVAGAPLLHKGRAYVGIYPQGLTVLELSSGAVLTNGSFSLTTASGLSPNLYVDAQGQDRILYEGATDDGISSQYEMLAADLDGNLLSPWDTALMMACQKGAHIVSFRQLQQGIVAAGGTRETAPVYVGTATSQYDSISCVCGFDLHTGAQLFRYQEAPIAKAIVWTSPLVDAQGRVYVLASNNDFTATFSALQEDTSRRHRADSREKQEHAHTQRIAEW